MKINVLNSWNEFTHFFRESYLELLANKNLYLFAFIALILLGNAETLWPLFGVGAESTANIILTVLTAILTFIILAQVVLIQKKKHGGSGELSFIVPTFLLYNIYYSMIFFITLIVPVLFIYLPFVSKNQILFFTTIAIGVGLAFVVSTYFYMVPLIAVCDDEVTGKFFKASRVMVKKNFGLVAWLAFISLVIEFSAFAFSLMTDPVLKAGAMFVYSLPDALCTLVLTIASVKIFYRLKNS